MKMNYDSYMPEYTEINVMGYDMIKYEIPGDGSCLFHALSLAFFKPYIIENFNGNYISRNQIVSNLRKELSEKLAEPINGKHGKTYYDIINNGHTAEFSKTVPEFSLRYMQSQLYSKNYIGYGFLEYICNQINKDIYIIHENNLYKSDELTVKGRNAIVLYYTNNHYELLGLKKNNITHFKPKHEFIQFLNTKLILKS
jgi:hypothetical protein